MELYVSIPLCVILGYLIGSIQPGIILSHCMGKGDIREKGSHSTGTTNVYRMLGKKPAIFVFIVDCCKGVLAAWLGSLLAANIGAMAGGMAAVTGHIWPVFFQFKGGKGVATSLGVLSFVNPVYSCIYLFVLIPIALKTRMISLGNICGALCLIVVNSTMSIVQRDWVALGFGICVFGMLLFAHRANIRRLLHGKEKRVDIFSKQNPE